MSTFAAPHCTVCLLALCLSACATPPDQHASAEALSVRAAVAAQIAHPEAVRNADPVAGIDGTAALQAQKNYEKSYARPAGAVDGGAPMVQNR